MPTHHLLPLSLIQLHAALRAYAYILWKYAPLVLQSWTLRAVERLESDPDAQGFKTARFGDRRTRLQRRFCVAIATMYSISPQRVIRTLTYGAVIVLTTEPHGVPSLGLGETRL